MRMKTGQWEPAVLYGLPLLLQTLPWGFLTCL